MPSIPVSLPDPKALQQAFTQHDISPINLLKLSWSLVAEQFLSTEAFQFQTSHQDDAVSDFPGQLDSSDIEVCSNSQDLDSAKSAVIASLLCKTPDTALENGDTFQSSNSSTGESVIPEQRVWSKLQIVLCGNSELYKISSNKRIKECSEVKPCVTARVEISGADIATTSLLYDDGSVSKFSAENMARAFGTSIHSIIHNLGGILSDIDLFTDYDERRLKELNASRPAAVQDCLHHLFEKSAAEFPQSIAIDAWDGTLTYAELNELSSRLAHHLINEYDIQPEIIVPLCFEKSLFAAVTMLAVLKAGAAYTCLDPSHPEERRKFILNTIDANLVLTTRLQKARFDSIQSVVVDSSLLTRLAQNGTPGSNPQTDVKSSNAATVSFTSGTTGFPKAFLHEHISLCSGVLANSSMLDMTKNSRVYQFASYTFDASFTEMYNTWINGGCCCIPSDEDRMNSIAETMNQMQINWAFFTPPLARFIRQASIPSLATVALGGEAVTLQDVADWESKGIKVLNCYSPSESSSWYVSPLSVRSPNGVTLGRTKNTLGWIVDMNNDQRLMPIGAVGELLLEGPCLARGYLKNPEKTVESFIQAPVWRQRYGKLPFPRFYKTGDLVRLCDDGTIAYIGRKDTQVKLRGQRIEMAEVEHHTRKSLPSSAQSATEIVTPPGKDPTLVAFVAFGEGLEQLLDMGKVQEHLRTRLRKSLPHYMIPQEFLLIPEMPYMPSGKVDRQKLQVLGTSLLTEQPRTNGHEQLSETFWSEDATALRDLWSQVLHLDSQHIKIDDDFFSLGGTSMDVMKLVVVARTKDVKVAYIDVFNSPTISALTSKVSRLSRDETDRIPAPFSLIKSGEKDKIVADAVAQCQIPRAAIEDIYPCTPQQEGIWALSLVSPGDYAGQFVIKLAEYVDAERICRAFEWVVASNPILRSRIIRSGSGSYQVVLQEQIEWVTTSSLAEYLKSDESISPNLGEPLSRHAIITGTDPPTMVWSCHHALIDGRSHQLILEAVAQEYHRPKSQQRRYGVPFNKFIEFIQNGDEEGSRTYWKKRFEGLRNVNFPSLPSPNYRPSASESFSNTLENVRKTGSPVTASTILRAAWALAVGQHTKTHDVVFGVTLAGTSSSMPLVESVIGPTFVTLPVRVILDLGKSISHLLETTQAQAVEGMKFEHYGMQKISTINQECQTACHFQSLLVVQQAPDRNNIDGVFEWHEASQDLKRFNSYAVVWECTMNGDSVDLVASFDGNVISKEDIQKLAANFKNFVHTLAFEQEDRLLSSFVEIDVPDLGMIPAIDHEIMHPKIKTEMDVPLMAKLKQCWSDTFGLQAHQLTAEDDFFGSGGNSISAMSLVANARALGVTLSVADIFRYPRLGLLAAIATEASIEHPRMIKPFSLLGSTEKQIKIRESAAAQCSVEVSEVENILPSTALQAGLMVLSQSTIGAYIAQYILSFDETLSEHEITSLLEKVVDNFPILRTRIIREEEGCESLQVVISQRPRPQVLITSLQAYFEKDRKTLMDYGESLCRFSLVKENAADSSHTVVWTVHHALYDESVVRMIIDAVNTIHKKSNPAPLVSFDSFVEHVVTADKEAAREYWATYLKDRPSTNFPRLPSSSYKPSANSTVTAQINFAKTPRSGITVPSLLRAAWALLVRQYSGSNDVLFGQTLSGRSAPVPSIEKIMGPTITTVPVRIQVELDKPAKEWMNSVQAEATDMMPFEQAGLSNIDSYCPGAADFQSLLIVHTSPQVPETGDGSIVTVHEAPNVLSYFNSYSLMWACNINPTGAELLISFDDKVLDSQQVLRLVRTFESLVQSLCMEPDVPISSLLHITPSDFAELKAWNENYPREINECLDKLIEPGFFRDPEKFALEAWDGSMTYKDLQQKTSILAKYLVEQGVGPDIIVPLCFEKTKWAVVSMLAVLKAGGAFAFLDPTHGSERLKATINTINPKVLLTTRTHMALFNGLDCRMIIIDPLLIDSLCDDNPGLQTYRNCSMQPEHPSYIIFTSGTTGVPKGIVHTHTSISSSIVNHEPIIRIDASTRAYQWSAFTYDGIIPEILATLRKGGAVCMPHESERLTNPAEYVNRMRLTWATVTASFARVLRGVGSGEETEVPTMETLYIGGEPVTAYEVREWAPRLQLIQCYSPSETQGWFMNPRPQDAREPNDGRGVGVQAWIMDENLQLVPIGATGEIVQQGPSLAVGYLGDPQKTAKAFVDTPSWLPHAEQGNKLYRTGDLGYLNSDGTIKILGRMDTRVKLNGQRLELAEVEFHMKQYLPTMADAAAEIIKPGGDEKSAMLVGFISVQNDDVASLFEQLQEKLLASLPTYMVPSAFIPYTPFPMNFNGKLDRRRLRDYAASLSLQALMKFSGGSNGQLWHKLRDDEHVAIQINNKIVEMVGTKDSEYAETIVNRNIILANTGLDSIRIISLATFVAKTFGSKIAVTKLMQQGTSIRDIVRFIAEAKTGGQKYAAGNRIDILAEFKVLDQTLSSLQAANPSENSNRHVRTVFLTGGTGFLGSQILYQLLSRSHVERIILLVRARDSRHGLERVVRSARIGRWWSPKFKSRLEVWLGDLSEPRLGLDDQHWQNLSGEASIDAIIHNGAVVHWDKDYMSLRNANVMSTVGLLSVVGKNPNMRFCYVSGGEMGGAVEDEDEKTAEELATAGGYAQTKFVSGILVKSFATRYPKKKGHISILTPAWILGSLANGVSNTDDFLWRLVASSVRIKAFNGDNSQDWMSMAGADQVAQTVIEHCFRSDESADITVKMLDGMTAGEFWAVVKEATGADLKPVASATWLQLIREDIATTGETHPMWPVFHWAEMSEGRIGDERPVGFKGRVPKEDITTALKKSVEYLACIGYLESRENILGDSEGGQTVFSRSGTGSLF